MINSFNESFHDGKLSEMQNTSVLSLIHKKNERTYLKKLQADQSDKCRLTYSSFCPVNAPTKHYHKNNLNRANWIH